MQWRKFERSDIFHSPHFGLISRGGKLNSSTICDKFQKFLFCCLPWVNPANWCLSWERVEPKCCCLIWIYIIIIIAGDKPDSWVEDLFMWSSESFQIHDFLSPCTKQRTVRASHPSHKPSFIWNNSEARGRESVHCSIPTHHPLNILLLSPSSPQTLSPAISPSRCTQCAIMYFHPPDFSPGGVFVKSLLLSRWDCFACVQMETFEMCIKSKIRKNTLKMQDKYVIHLMAKIKWKISSSL